MISFDGQLRKAIFVVIIVQCPAFCPTLRDLMDCSSSGLPHHPPKFVQVYVHCISDTIQSSHPLMPSFPSALNLSQHQRLFQWVLFCIGWPKYWSFSFSINLSSVYLGWSPLRLTGLIPLLSKGLSGVFSSTTVRRNQFFGVLLLYSPALPTLCDHWEEHSLDYMDLCRQSDVSAFQHTV